MVSYEQTHRQCRRCGKPTIHYRKATSHVLHLLLTLVTCGWWAIMWLLLTLKIGGWRCQECGAGARLPKMIGGAVVIVGLVVTGLMIVGMMQSLPSSSNPRRPSTPTPPSELVGHEDPPTEAAAVSVEPAIKPGAPDPAPLVTNQVATPEPAMPDPAPAEEKYVVYNAADVYGYYDQNEIRGDRELKGKWFAVIGRVQEVNKDILGTPYIVFRGDGWIFGVQCMFPRSAEGSLVDIIPGNVVTVAGECSGKHGNVILEECRFYSPPAPEPEMTAREKRRQDPPPPRPKEEPRTWTDVTGQFTIEAEFAGYAVGNVRLKKADGSTLVLPMEKLSQSDQDWIRDRGR